MKLNSSWKETKDFLLSLSVEDRRPFYKTPNKYHSLEDIPVFTPISNGSERPRYPRNEKLDQKISLYGGDITKLEIDAIVNAANKSLLGGSGVDGAIHDAAGHKLMKECATLNGCQTGKSKITGGYGLPAKYVIHTVGPIVFGGVGAEDRARLRECYSNTLELAAQNNIRTLAVPCISTGIYSYPREKAACEALATVREYLDVHHDKFDRVIFCVFLQKDKEIYLKNLPLYFPGASSSGLTGKEQTEEQTSTDKEQTSTDKEEKTEERASKGPIDDKEQTEEQTSTDKEQTSTEKEGKTEERASKGPIDDKEQTEEQTEEQTSTDAEEQTEHEGM